MTKEELSRAFILDQLVSHCIDARYRTCETDARIAKWLTETDPKQFATFFYGQLEFLDEATLDEAVGFSPSDIVAAELRLPKEAVKSNFVHSFLRVLNDYELYGKPAPAVSRPPIQVEYVLYLLLPKEDQEVIIGDLIERYGLVLRRFGNRHADVWFYKEVAGSLWPLLKRAVLKVGILVWLGRILRRLIS